MLVGMIGLIVLALFSNIGYYEYMYKKPVKNDKDLISDYLVLTRKRKKLVGTFNGVGDLEEKSGTPDVDDFNAR
jgi:hypothetical protein